MDFIELTQIEPIYVSGGYKRETNIIGKISVSPDSIATFEETTKFFPPKGFYKKDKISCNTSITMIRLKNSEVTIFVAENYKAVQHEIEKTQPISN